MCVCLVVCVYNVVTHGGQEDHTRFASSSAESKHRNQNHDTGAMETSRVLHFPIMTQFINVHNRVLVKNFPNYTFSTLKVFQDLTSDLT